MSQQSLQDLIGTIKTQHADRFEDAKEGKGPSGMWDGPPLPLNNEYRVVVDSTAYSPSKSTGKMQFVFTYEITEPSEFAGRKLQDYVSPTPTNQIGSEQLANLFGALRADLDGWGDNFEAFVKQFEGRTAIIALRTWGEENDRYGVRWVNADRGQKLKTDVKPPKQKANTNNLRADIQIPKDPEAAPAPAPVTPPPAQPSAPAPAISGGPNLPPGLRG